MRQLGPYQVVRELGRGGAGVVFEGFDPRLQRKVALKLVQGVEPRQVQRFALEAQALAKLDHPSIVKVLHAGEQQGQPFVAMELVEGQDLEGRLAREGPLPIDDAVAVAQELAAALQHAHSRGIVHRDVKPSNVLIDRHGTPRLTDFGLALHLDAANERLSRSGHSLGSPGYWAPEQARGDRAAIGPRSDVYGLGATLYAMLTGRAPYTGESLGELLGAMARPPERPTALRPDVPPELEATCLRCLEARPEDRFPTIVAVSMALGRRSSGRPPTPPHAGRRSAAAGAPAAAIAAGVALCAAGVALGLWRASRSEDRARAAEASAAAAEVAAEQAAAAARRAEQRSRSAEEQMRAAAARADQATELAASAETRALEAEARARGADRVRARSEEEARQLLARPPGTTPAGSPWEEPLVVADRAEEVAAAAALPEGRPADERAALEAHRRATITHRQNDSIRAVEQYDEALRLDPRLAVAYRNRAAARASHGQHREAIADYTLAIGLGELERQAGSAVDVAELAAALHGRAEERSASLGFVDLPRAIRDYTRALTLVPDFALSLRGRGNAWLAFEQPARAIADLERYLEVAPGSDLGGGRPYIEKQLAKARAALPAR